MGTVRLLEGKVVVVTGAGRGIGRAIALELARSGAQVVVNDLGTSGDGRGNDSAPANEVVAEIEAGGGSAIASFESVAEWDSAHRIIQAAIDRFGRIDGVVNNAGILRDAIFHKATEEDFDLVIKVHLKGAFNMSRACAPCCAIKMAIARPMPRPAPLTTTVLPVSEMRSAMALARR